MRSSGAARSSGKLQSSCFRNQTAATSLITPLHAWHASSGRALNTYFRKVSFRLPIERQSAVACGPYTVAQWAPLGASPPLPDGYSHGTDWAVEPPASQVWGYLASAGTDF
jgi:hypothetical protein